MSLLNSKGEIKELRDHLCVIKGWSDKCSCMSFNYISRLAIDGVDILAIRALNTLMPLLCGPVGTTKMLKKFSFSNAFLWVLLRIRYRVLLYL